MNQRMIFTRRIKWLFAGVFFILLVVAGVTYLSLSEYVKSTAWVNHSYQVISQLEARQLDYKDAELQLRNYLVTGSPQYLVRYASERAQLLDGLNQLIRLVSDNPAQVRRLQHLKQGVSVLDKRWEPLILTRQNSLDQSTQLVQSLINNSFQALDNPFGEIREAEDALLSDRLSLAQHHFQYVLFSVLFGITIVLFLTSLALWTLKREVEHRTQAEEQLQALNINLESIVETRSAALRQRTEELESANRELEAFTYSVSHDLRAPMQKVASFAQLLERNSQAVLDEASLDYLTRIRRNSLHMLTLVDDLLKFSKVHRVELNITRIDLSALAREVMAELLSHEENPTVEVEIESDLTGFGDRPLIAAVLNNLFSNALKYTHQQDHPRIHFGRCSESLNQQAVFYVADNGIGFNMAYVHKLFVPFSRLHSRADYPGSGIGLSHAQRIIHRHGGEIWAEAEDGKGATFYFTLSVNPEDALRLARTILTPLEMASSAP